MKIPFKSLFIFLVVVAALGAGGYWVLDRLPLHSAGSDGMQTRPDAHRHSQDDRLKLTPQARAHLQLVVKLAKFQTYWRTISVPGVIVERRGKSDQSVVAPVAGIVQTIYALPGDTIEPGGTLLTLRVNSESLQSTQTELFKTAQEIKITQDQKKRLDDAAKQGAIAEARLLDLQYQLERLGAARKAYRADLAVKGLSKTTIDLVEQGEFLKEVAVRIPTSIETSAAKASNNDKDAKPSLPLLEVEELKIFPGEQVQAGQLLGYLANHQNLYIEGRGFREDTALVEMTAAKTWPVQARFSEEREGQWPVLSKPLTILYLSNIIEPTSQTFPFYIPLANQYREYSQGGRTYRIWRFRPGQRVELGVPVEELQNVLVLPQAALAREGVEMYVFRQNGEYFERRPVHIAYEDGQNAVVADDSAITPGSFIAQNAAEALNRALKSQQEGNAGHSHDHSH